jgi:hypothetical protein
MSLEKKTLKTSNLEQVGVGLRARDMVMGFAAIPGVINEMLDNPPLLATNGIPPNPINTEFSEVSANMKLCLRWLTIIWI